VSATTPCWLFPQHASPAGGQKQASFIGAGV